MPADVTLNTGASHPQKRGRVNVFYGLYYNASCDVSAADDILVYALIADGSASRTDF